MLLGDELAQHVEAVVDGAERVSIATFVGMANFDVVEVMFFYKSPFVFKRQALRNIGDGDAQHGEMAEYRARAQLGHVDR